MIVKILIAIALIVLIFVAIVAMQPASYRVTRTATISAAPAAVFEQVNDLHKWNAWSPWAKIDPDMKQTYEGPPTGVGASSSWSGNSKAGEGRMTITESHPSDLVKIRLDFVRPFPSTANSEFAFVPQGDQTTVTWAMSGEKNFMSKAFCMFVSMDKMVGGDFERGLTQLKFVSETPTKP